MKNITERSITLNEARCCHPQSLEMEQVQTPSRRKTRHPQFNQGQIITQEIVWRRKEENLTVGFKHNFEVKSGKENYRGLLSFLCLGTILNEFYPKNRIAKVISSTFLQSRLVIFLRFEQCLKKCPNRSIRWCSFSRNIIKTQKNPESSKISKKPKVGFFGFFG